MTLRILQSLAFVLAAVVAPVTAQGQVFPLTKPEQRRIHSRRPDQLRELPAVHPVAPPTVSVPTEGAAEWRLTLDEAIQLALQNSEVIRLFAGTSATSSGRTIYDAAMDQTGVEREKAAFDPVFSANNNFGRTSRAIADIVGDRLVGSRANSYNLDIGVSQRNLTGGQARAGFITDWSRSGPRGALNPRTGSSLEIAYTQPLLNGAGLKANRVPIILARITTERSYFQLKDTIQELTRGVVEAYWGLVFARTDLWAREQQVNQAQESYRVVEAQKRVGLSDLGDVSQQKVALANFRANLIVTRAALLDREAGMKNLLGLPPNDGTRIIPVTPPTREQIRFQWSELVNTAATERPDLIELKLILDADCQRLIQAKNASQASLDATALYRWNGLRGELPSGRYAISELNESTDWSVGVNFSVPVRLRAARANLRSTELLIARDRANLKQGQHAANHQIGQTLRTLASSYAQYEAFVLTREAALENLKLQGAEKRQGRTIFLNVLQAINDWGNAVSSEARSLTQYNSQLAQLERQTGTILQTHNIRFREDQYLSLGPLGKHHECCPYPRSLRPERDTARYKNSDKPAEEFFDLDQLPNRKQTKSRKLPRSSEPPLEIPEAPKSKPMPPESPPDRGNEGKPPADGAGSPLRLTPNDFKQG